MKAALMPYKKARILIAIRRNIALYAENAGWIGAVRQSTNAENDQEI